MAYKKQFSAHGVVEVGAFTGEQGSTITETPWGLTTQEGVRLAPTVNTVKQRSGQGTGAIASFVSEADVQVVISFTSAALDVLRLSMGLPTAALEGDLSGETPTEEVLTVRGDEIATEEEGIYVRTMGPLGPRTYYIPRCKVASLPELNMSRTAYTEPNATFDVYETEDGVLYWIEDAIA
jgi:hypothetical protein